MICLWQAEQLFAEAEGKSRYIAITEFNNCFIIRSDTEFVWISLGSKAICHFHATAIPRRRKARFPLRMSRILFAAKHCWTALRMSRPLFVGSYLQVTWWALGQRKERKICLNDNNNYAAILTDSHHNVMDNADKSWQFTNKNYPANRKNRIKQHLITKELILITMQLCDWQTKGNPWMACGKDKLDVQYILLGILSHFVPSKKKILLAIKSILYRPSFFTKKGTTVYWIYSLYIR